MSVPLAQNIKLTGIHSGIKSRRRSWTVSIFSLNQLSNTHPCIPAKTYFIFVISLLNNVSPHYCFVLRVWFDVMSRSQTVDSSDLIVSSSVCTPLRLIVPS